LVGDDVVAGNRAEDDEQTDGQGEGEEGALRIAPE
jgi:hypothetical protein